MTTGLTTIAAIPSGSGCKSAMRAEVGRAPEVKADPTPLARAWCAPQFERADVTYTEFFDGEFFD